MKSLEKLKPRQSKVKSLAFSLFTFALILSGALSLLCGCRSYGQPGETVAEGRRRHERVLRINQQEMMADIDRTLLLDSPSKLTDKRIP